MQIVTIGEEILRQKALPVTDIDSAIQELTQEMLQMMRVGKGIGLAAPQIGLASRIFVVEVDNDKPRVFINPSILETSTEQSKYEEGCLSIPGIYADVSRAANVKIQAWNERGRPFTLDADGILARVILHEYDHLEGTLFIDRLPEHKQQKLLAQYQKKIRM